MNREPSAGPVALRCVAFHRAGLRIRGRRRGWLLERDPAPLDYFLEVERARYVQHPWMAPYFRFREHAGARVLEIGVGQGTDLVQFARGGAHCHGIDVTDAHLALTERNFDLRHLSVDLKPCDAVAIDYPHRFFDVVYCFGVAHHVPDADAVVNEIDRVLTPGGRLRWRRTGSGRWSHTWAGTSCVGR